MTHAAPASPDILTFLDDFLSRLLATERSFGGA